MKPRADLAVIFAGGRGTRLFQSEAESADKGAALIAGSPLYAYTASRLAPQAARLAVIAPTRPDWLDQLPEGTRHLSDALGDDKRPTGPAGALVLALQAGAEIADDALVLTSPIDSPFLPLDLYERLAAALHASGAGAAIVSTRGKLHPVFALWRAALAEDVRKLVEGEKMRALFKIAANVSSVEVMAWDDVTMPPPFFNINTSEELEMANDFANLTGAAP